MILTYHSIGELKNQNYISACTFEKQINQLISFGYEFQTFETYDKYNPKHVLITFDDGRKDIYEVLPLLQKFSIPFYVFIVGELFNSSSEFLGEEDVKVVREYGGMFGWHSKTHCDLTALSEAELVEELKNPFGLNILAYPYWKWNERVINVAKDLGYQYCRSGNGYADNSLENFALDSVFVREFSQLKYINDKIVKYIDMAIMSPECNLRCHYCYLGHYANEIERRKIYPFKYSPEDLTNALDIKRMGGICIVTVSAAGETLISEKNISYLFAVLNAGHFLHISTNLTITSGINKLLSLSSEQKSRLFVKASLQFLELKRKKMLEVFSENCQKLWNDGITCAIEVVPTDELIPHLAELKTYCLKNFGALPQLTMPRDENVQNIKLLSKFSLDEFSRIFEDFYSEEFRFKTEMWEKTITSFCYAGSLSFFVNVNNGDMLVCPKSKKIGNFFEGVALPSEPIGKCPQSHCFVCHNWLGFGSNPSICGTNYLLQRDRVTLEGKHWVSERCRHAFRQRVCDNNRLLSKEEERVIYEKASNEQYLNSNTYKAKNVLSRIASSGFSKVSIYGAGFLGQAIISELKNFNLELVYLYDSSEKQIGRNICGTDVLRFSEETVTGSRKSDCVIIASVAFKEEIFKSIKQIAERNQLKIFMIES